MGIGCAVLAPFMIGGSSEDASVLYYYFALIGAVALVTDSVSRTAWVSSIGLLMVYAGTAVLYLADPGGELHLLAFGVLTCTMTITVPTRSIRPQVEGGIVFVSLHRQGVAETPSFPTRVGTGRIIALAAIAITVAGQTESVF